MAYTDSFTGTAGDEIPSPWRNDDVLDVSRLVYSGSGEVEMETPGSDTFYVYDAATDDIQFSEATVAFNATSGVYVGLLVRVDGVGATFRGYWYYNDGASTEQLLVYHGDGTQDVLWTGANPGFSIGDVFRLTANGSTLLIEKNDVEVDTVIDAEFSDGITGITAIGSGGVWRLSQWRGGSGAGSGGDPLDAEYEGAGVIDLGGEVEIEYITMNVLVVGDQARPASINEPDRFLRQGYVALGHAFADGDQPDGVYWQQPVWTDFLRTVWYPVNQHPLATHLRYQITPGGAIHFYVKLV